MRGRLLPARCSSRAWSAGGFSFSEEEIMGKFFDKLPANYRAAIDKAIKKTDGGLRPDIAQAYRESEAESLLECDISAKDGPEKVGDSEFNDHYIWFMEGWDTALKSERSLL
jgi:hypothetical protein